MGYDDEYNEWDDWEDYENVGPGGPLMGTIPVAGQYPRGGPKAKVPSRSFAFVNALEPGPRVMRGVSELISVSATEESTAELISVQSPKGDPVVFGVHLSQVVQIIGGLQRTYNGGATAIVEWGVDGTAHRALIDILNGTTFNVLASSLIVSAFIDAGFSIAPDRITVRSSVAWGGVSVGTLAPIRSFNFLVPVGFTIPRDIPAFAQSIDLHRGIFTTPITIEISTRAPGGAVGTLLSTTVIAAGTNLARPIPVSRHAAVVELSGVTASTNVELVFGLNL